MPNLSTMSCSMCDSQTLLNRPPGWSALPHFLFSLSVCPVGPCRPLGARLPAEGRSWASYLFIMQMSHPGDGRAPALWWEAPADFRDGWLGRWVRWWKRSFWLESTFQTRCLISLGPSFPICKMRRAPDFFYSGSGQAGVGFNFGVMGTLNFILGWWVMWICQNPLDGARWMNGSHAMWRVAH